MVGIEYYRDEAGNARARGLADYGVLIDYLESDVQGSTTTAREILEGIDRVSSGQEKSWELTGNAYTLSLSPERATIVFETIEEDDEPPKTYSLEDLREGVKGWLEFLEKSAAAEISGSPLSR
jgi:uncharacterized protein YacL (UPF0231 family)